MRLSDVRIIPGATAGCVVEGRFGLETPHYSGGEALASARDRISLFMGGPHGVWINLSELFEDSPGFFSRTGVSDRLSLHLPGLVDFEGLLYGMSNWPGDREPRYLEWAALSMESEFGWVSGRIPSLRVETTISEVGLGVSLSGDVGPLITSGSLRKPGAPVPTLADSRIHADIVIPWAFLIVQGSKLAGLEGGFHTPGEADTPFDFDRPGLAGVAFSRDRGPPFFQGRFAVQRGIGGPYVRAKIDDKALVLNPCGHPLVRPDGFAIGSPSDPAITYTLALVGLGYDAWAKILNGENTGRLELKGEGIGHLTEATWLGSAAGRHAISACRIDLELGDTELVVKIEGEVDRLLQHKGLPLPPTLGPIFWVTMRIPVAFLAARNIDLLAWGQREKLALDSSRVP